MPSKLSINWMPAHIDESDWRILARINPPYPKIFQWSTSDPFFVERLLATITSPIVCRDHPLSEEKGELATAPAALGRRHADFWIDKYNSHLRAIKGASAARFVFCGINEPGVDVYEPGSGYARRLPRPNPADRAAEYTVAYLDRLSAAGLRGMALNLSVGWPDNNGPDTPVDWSPFDQVRGAILRGQHVLGLHEYWSPDGPQRNFGWWLGRLGQCPWNVPIVLGEAGMDYGVVQLRNNLGWQHFAHLTKEVYLDHLIWADKELRRDPRVLAAQIFSYDFYNPWSSFDVRPLREELATYCERERSVSDGVTRAIPYYPPNVILGPAPADPFVAWLKIVGQEIATVPVTPDFALYKRILADGFIPNGPEVRRAYQGVEYALRSAENGAEKRTYYARAGDWANVRYVRR